MADGDLATALSNGTASGRSSTSEGPLVRRAAGTARHLDEGRSSLSGSPRASADRPRKSRGGEGNASAAGSSSALAETAESSPSMMAAQRSQAPSPIPPLPQRSSDDVTVAEIREHGLKMLLRSRLPLCYFLRFLLEEHSCENLICYLEIEHYESQRYESALEQQTAAMQILDVYLSPRSPFEVNVTERAHAQCQASIGSDDPTRIASCFVNVKPAVFQLLLDAHVRFMRSEWWRSLVAQLDDKQTYSTEDRNATVGHLIGYLDRLHKHDLVHAPDRAALFRELIADFCRTVVGVEIVLAPSPPGSSRSSGGPPPVPSGTPPAYPHEGGDGHAAMRKIKSNPLMKLKNSMRKWG